MTTKAEEIEQVAADLGITMQAEFVPWSKSRNAGEKQPSLNWKVSLLKNGKEFLKTDYMASCGHAPSYKQGRMSMHDAEAVKLECEHGKPVWKTADETSLGVPRFHGKPILPKLADVLHSLASDANAIDYPTFEEWANDIGDNPDSRKAEAIYKTCLETGLKLRSALGDAGLTTLREAVADY